MEPTTVVSGVHVQSTEPPSCAVAFQHHLQLFCVHVVLSTCDTVVFYSVISKDRLSV